MEPKPVPRSTAGHAARNCSFVNQRPHLAGDELAFFRGLEVGDDLGEAEQTHRDAHHADAVGQFGDAEREPLRAGVHVGADDAQQQSSDDHRDRLDERAARQHDGADEAEHHEREVFGGTELERELGQRNGDAGDQHRGDRPREERPERGDRECGARLSLARHLVAVEAGDHRRRFARHVEQDGRRRPAVLGAVVDAGEHDERGHRLQRVGRGQQHRDGRDGPDAGQHADQRAEQQADERVDEVDRRQRDPETQGEVAEEFHVAISVEIRPDGKLEVQADDEHADRERREERPAMTDSLGRNSWLAALAPRSG